jgi:uncharacterized repeat protein (TIGR02543 family)
LKRATLLSVLAFVAGVVTFPSQAATINVAAGEVIVSPGNGKCSLREAILNAESGNDTSGGDCAAGSAGGDIISLAFGTYVLSDQDPNHIDGEVNGLPEIHYQITINGNGSTIQRDPLFTGSTACGGVGARFRIFYVSGLGQLTLNDLTLQNGCANVSGLYGAGGAIFNRGTLTLNNVTVSNNEAFRSGGGIHNDGTLTITGSTVSNNVVTAPEAGGGGIVNRGTMQVLQSTISGNNGAGAGGGVDTGMGNATFANSTVSSNVAAGDGAGIFSRSPSSTVLNSTVVLNQGVVGGLGSNMFLGSGTVTLTNSLVAEPVNGANCSGVSGGGNNLADDATCPTATVATPLIGPLANNGGPTQTHALLLGSPAIDAGNNTVCSASPVNAVDQRGTPRPQGATCDIGAFEIGKYSVVYDGNGDTGGSVPASNTYTTGQTVTVSGNTGPLVKTGYSFVGWNTAADGSGTPYAGGATFTMGTGNVTLYAQWTINSYTVTYNGNGNTGGSAPVDGSSPHNYNSTVTVQVAGSLIRTGYTFAGWNTAANGSGTAYATGAMFTMPAVNTTLFAQWTINTYTITYDGNGNTGGSAPVDGGSPHIYNSTVPVLGAGSLIRTGYTFAGWNTAANGSGTSYAVGATFTVPAANTTLYAQWTINSYTVTYDGNGNTGGSAPVDGGSPHIYNSTVTVPGAGSLIRFGYTFAGWNTAADGSGTAYTVGATFTMPAANTTLYAHWTINTSYTAPSATGTGTITASFTGGGAGCGYTVSQFIPLTGNAASPPAGSAPLNVSFPEGLFDFKVSGCTPGSTLNFTITYPQPLLPGMQYWKYGPTSTNTTPHWYALPAVVSGNVVTFSITDGGLGDDDFALGPNGTVVDQGGPAGVLIPVPALSEWVLALLALLMVGLGLRQGLR